MQQIRLWLLAFAGFFLVAGAWSVAAPYSGSPDEGNHIVRAYGVMSGQVAPKPEAAEWGTGAYQTVPASLTGDPNCWRKTASRSAACAGKPNGDMTPVRRATMVGRYSPVYYVFVGLPIKIWPTMKGVVLARLISAAICAALLATAMLSVVRYSRFRLMLGGLLLAVSPMAVEMFSAVNPNGLEIAAGITFVTTAIPILIGPARERPPRWLICAAVISAVILVSVRSSGPSMLALTAVPLLPLRWQAVRDLLRIRALRWGLAAIGVVGAASVVWIVLMKATVQQTAPRPHPMATPGEIAIMELNRWPRVLEQLVGNFAWLDTPMSPLPNLAWQHLATLLLIVALIVGTWADRRRLVLMVGGAVAIFALYETLTYNEYGIGLYGQGRYLLPVLGGGLVLAAWIMEQRGFSAQNCLRLTRTIVVVTLPVQFHSLWITMVRYQNGIPDNPRPRDYNPFVGTWHPAVGSATPLVLAVLGLAAVGWMGWRYARPQDPAVGGTVNDQGAATSLEPSLAG